MLVSQGVLEVFTLAVFGQEAYATQSRLQSLQQDFTELQVDRVYI